MIGSGEEELDMTAGWRKSRHGPSGSAGFDKVLTRGNYPLGDAKDYAGASGASLNETRLRRLL
jgi:hypothetical protein